MLSQYLKRTVGFPPSPWGRQVPWSDSDHVSKAAKMGGTIFGHADSGCEVHSGFRPHQTLTFVVGFQVGIPHILRLVCGGSARESLDCPAGGVGDQLGDVARLSLRSAWDDLRSSRSSARSFSDLALRGKRVSLNTANGEVP